MNVGSLLKCQIMNILHLIFPRWVEKATQPILVRVKMFVKFVACDEIAPMFALYCSKLKSFSSNMQVHKYWADSGKENVPESVVSPEGNNVSESVVLL